MIICLLFLDFGLWLQLTSLIILIPFCCTYLAILQRENLFIKDNHQTTDFIISNAMEARNIRQPIKR